MQSITSQQAGAADLTSLRSFNDHIAEAKARLPLPLLMERRGLAEHARPSAFCPFHENTRTKAFSVFQDERGLWRWKCHSQCGSGDEITLLEKLDGLPNREATRQFLAAAGVDAHNRPSSPASRDSAPPPAPAPQRPAPRFPAMERGSADDLARLGDLRHVGKGGLMTADAVGLLRFANLHGQRAWIITDKERVNAQARRLDGQPWEHIGAKAWTLPGSRASHPLGCWLALHYPNVLIVEGGPDLLAALDFVFRFAHLCHSCPVAMLGASQRIPAAAFPIFVKKHVRIYPHTDPPGLKAAQVWTRQVLEAGAERVDAFNFKTLRRATGEPVKDLNDCTTIHADDAAKLEGLLPII